MFIDGPAGALEAKFDPVDAPRGIAILCHPHPQYGGSMHDGVLAIAAQQCAAAEFSVLRFNFRGVGMSQGSYDSGVGEIEDLLAVHAWAKSQGISERVLWLGYSFGAAVVWQALQEQTPARAMLIAPPTAMMPFDPAIAVACPVDAFAGERDNYVEHSQLQHHAAISTHVIDQADHFFTGCHDALADALGHALTVSP